MVAPGPDLLRRIRNTEGIASANKAHLVSGLYAKYPTDYLDIEEYNNLMATKPWMEPVGDIKVLQDSQDSQDNINKLSALPVKNTSNTDKILLICVDFSDQPATLSTSTIYNRFFGTTGKTLRNYYIENSYGVYTPEGILYPISGWYRAPKTIAYYAGNDHGISKTVELSTDVINLVNNDPNVTASIIASLDIDNDGKLSNVIIIHAGGEYTAGSGVIWSHMATIVTTGGLTLKGKTLTQYAVVSEYFWSTTDSRPVGADCHEFGHLLGLPDLYDVTLATNGIGSWSLMSHGSWIDSATTPTHLDPWCKIRLGWMSATTETTGQIIIPNSENYSVVYSYQSVYDGMGEYFLIENRQRVLFDAYLPGDGLLIWHINAYSSQATYQDYSNRFCHLLNLVQADNLKDLEYVRNLGDNKDSYPGGSNNRSLTPTSSPNSYFCYLGDSGISITNISNSSSMMTADVSLNTSLAVDYVYILTSPQAAKIFIDGVDTTYTTPHIFRDKFGYHDYILKLSGYSDISGNFTLNSGQKIVINKNFQLLPGIIFANTNPTGAQIFKYGQDLLPVDTGQVTPYTFYDVPLNSILLLEFRKTGYQICQQLVSIVSGQQVNVTCNLNPSLGSVRFHTSPGTAEIWSGSTLLGTTDTSGILLVSNLATGSLSYVVKKTGYNDSSTQTVTVVYNTTVDAPLVTLTLPGTVSVTTNNTSATFTITGPATYSGSGTSWTHPNSPTGTYSITFGTISGYTTPIDTPKTLTSGGTISFSGTYTPAITTGTLSVTTNNTSATFTITGPATYSGSGTSWSQANAPTGTYSIVFNPISGYTTPTDIPKTLINGGTASFTGTYIQQTGTLSVTTNNASATFTITGPATYTGSGTSWTRPNSPIGTYSITFNPISGYTTPTDTPKTLTNGGTASFSGTYTPVVTTGTLSVTTNNPSATFTITGPATYSGSGTSWTRPNSPTGTYSIIFGAISGYITPTDTPKTLTSGGTASFTGAYTPIVTTGTISVTTNNVNATFTITGSATYTGSGTSWNQTNAPTGTYSIVFNPISGYTTPTDTPKTLTSGGTVSFTGIYISTAGSVRFHTNPGTAEVWSGTTLLGTTDYLGTLLISNLPVGDLNFVVKKTGYDNSSIQTVTVIAGTIVNTSLIILSPAITTGSIRFHTNPGTAEVWSGTTLLGTTDYLGVLLISNLSVGNINFVIKKAGYNNSPIQTVTVIENTIVDTQLITLSPAIVTGSVILHTSPGIAEIWSGNTLLGITDYLGILLISNLPVGDFNFVVKKIGYIDSLTQTVTISADTIVDAPLIILSPSITTGSIRFHTNPGTADIWSGTTLLGTTDYLGILLKSNLLIGNLDFVIKKIGYNNSPTQTITVIENAIVDAQLINLSPAIVTGSIRFHTNPGTAEVWSGTTLLGTTDYLGILLISNLPVGDLNFVIKKTGYEDSPTQTITVVENIIVDTPLVSLSVTIATGSIMFHTDPTESEVWSGTTLLGTTDYLGILLVSNLPVGDLDFVIKKTGYNDSPIQTVIIINNIVIYSPLITLSRMIEQAGFGSAGIIIMAGLAIGAMYQSTSRKTNM